MAPFPSMTTMPPPPRTAVAVAEVTLSSCMGKDVNALSCPSVANSPQKPGLPVFPYAPMREQEVSLWQPTHTSPPYTPHVPFGHTHHPGLGHVDLLYMQHVDQRDEYYVELHPFPARYQLDAHMTALVQQLNIISGDALQATAGSGRALDEYHRLHQGASGSEQDHHGSTSPKPHGLGQAHILHQLQPTLALVLIRDAVSHCARYYLRWDVYEGVIGTPVGFAVYRWQSEQKTYHCMGSWTRFMCRQQILRQRQMPAQQKQMRRVLFQINRRYTTPVGSLCTRPKASSHRDRDSGSSTTLLSSSSLLPSPSPDQPRLAFVAENTLFMVLRTDNTRLLESRMKQSAAQLPDFTYVGSQLPVIAAALLLWCHNHHHLDLWQQLVKEGVVVLLQPGKWTIDLSQLGRVVRSDLSSAQWNASNELVCADFLHDSCWDSNHLPDTQDVESDTDTDTDKDTDKDAGDSDPEDELLDDSMLVRRLVQLQQKHELSWIDLIGQLNGFMRCFYRSTVPSVVAEMLDGVMRTSFEGVSTLCQADAYIWCVRNASPSVKQNVNKKPATLPIINDIYALLAGNRETEEDSRNYLLNILVMDLHSLAESRWVGTD